MSSSTLVDAMGQGLGLMRAIGLLIALAFPLTGLTRVAPGEVAVVLRMGQLVGRTPAEQVRSPGLFLALPAPIDRVIRVPVKQEIEVACEGLWRSLTAGKPTTDAIDPLAEGYALTGDEMILQLRAVARYQIVDPVQFALRAPDPEALVVAATTGAMTQVLARWKSEDALRLTGPARDGQPGEHLVLAIAAVARARLEALEVGLTIASVDLKEVHPPRHVVAAFERAQSARVVRDTLRRTALGQAAHEIPKAEAERDRLVREATVAASAATATATAEGRTFRELHARHAADPAAMRARMIVDARQEILERAARRVFVPAQRGAGDVRVLLSGIEDER